MTKEELINTPNGRVSDEVNNASKEVEFALRNEEQVSVETWNILIPGLQNYFRRSYPKLTL
jgi:hypothetical protein